MHQAQIDHFEHIGEAEVLRLLSLGQLGEPGSLSRSAVDSWLALKALERSRASSASAESMAAEHLRIARQQKSIAIAAMVLSAITAIIAAFIGGILSYSSSSPIQFQGAPSAATSPAPAPK